MEFKTKKSKANRKKPRTPRTFANKITKLQAQYRKTTLSSHVLKTRNESTTPAPKRTRAYFCDKYPTFESWLAILQLKQSGVK